MGEAVWTEGGRLRCGIVHAVGLAYEPKVLATPDSVRKAFAAALHVAVVHGCQTVAAKLMCARPGYSSETPQDAPAVMLASMLRAVEDVRQAGALDGLEQVIIFVPTPLISLPHLNSRTLQVFLCVTDVDLLAMLVQKLIALSARVVVRPAVVEEVMASKNDVVVTSQNSDAADLSLCSALRAHGFVGHLALYRSHFEPTTTADAWMQGACLVTDKVPELRNFLQRLCVSARAFGM